MRNRFALPLNLAFALALAGSPLTAQTSGGESDWSLDLQAGAAVPTAEIDGDDLGTGFGFEGTLAYRVAPHAALYAGWDWHGFAPDNVLGRPDLDLEETGYVFGLRFDHPFRGEAGSGPAYRLRAGVTVNHIEIEDADGEIIDDSGHGAGFEVGAGVLFPVGERWRFGPEARYRSLGSALEVDGAETDLSLRYIAFALVFGRRF